MQSGTKMEELFQYLRTLPEEMQFPPTACQSLPRPILQREGISLVDVLDYESFKGYRTQSSVKYLNHKSWMTLIYYKVQAYLI